MDEIENGFGLVIILNKIITCIIDLIAAVLRYKRLGDLVVAYVLVQLQYLPTIPA